MELVSSDADILVLAPWKIQFSQMKDFHFLTWRAGKKDEWSRAGFR